MTKFKLIRTVVATYVSNSVSVSQIELEFDNKADADAAYERLSKDKDGVLDRCDARYDPYLTHLVSKLY